MDGRRLLPGGVPLHPVVEEPRPGHRRYGEGDAVVGGDPAHLRRREDHRRGGVVRPGRERTYCKRPPYGRALHKGCIAGAGADRLIDHLPCVDHLRAGGSILDEDTAFADHVVRRNFRAHLDLDHREGGRRRDPRRAYVSPRVRLQRPYLRRLRNEGHPYLCPWNPRGERPGLGEVLHPGPDPVSRARAHEHAAPRHPYGTPVVRVLPPGVRGEALPSLLPAHRGSGHALGIRPLDPDPVGYRTEAETQRLRHHLRDRGFDPVRRRLRPHPAAPVGGAECTAPYLRPREAWDQEVLAADDMLRLHRVRCPRLRGLDLDHGEEDVLRQLP